VHRAFPIIVASLLLALTAHAACTNSTPSTSSAVDGEAVHGPRD
jgi:hypothetical protein